MMHTHTLPHQAVLVTQTHLATWEAFFQEAVRQDDSPQCGAESVVMAKQKQAAGFILMFII